LRTGRVSFYKIPKETEHTKRWNNAEVYHHLNSNHREHMKISEHNSEFYYHIMYVGL
jgi:hypothetical protein